MEPATPKLEERRRAASFGSPPFFLFVHGDTTIRLPIKVVPGSSRNCISGWLGDTLKVRVTAPAERGKANAAVEAVIAEALGVPKECVCIAAGHSSSRKFVEVTGLSEDEVSQRLSNGVA